MLQNKSIPIFVLIVLMAIVSAIGCIPMLLIKIILSMKRAYNPTGEMNILLSFRNLCQLACWALTIKCWQSIKIKFCCSKCVI